ncbi:hypothetical protein ADJ70_07155 [Olsenella sp. oral taxon 807]|nr:hypothetical protein ADJ70_07155 [Olsenella sp. oral taxon 807]
MAATREAGASPVGRWATRGTCRRGSQARVRCLIGKEGGGASTLGRLSACASTPKRGGRARRRWGQSTHRRGKAST